MGIRQLEAGFLSSEAARRQVPEPLLQPAKFSGGELHVSPLSFAEIASGLGRFNSDEFQICIQSKSANHTFHAASRRRRAAIGIRSRPRTAAKSKETRTASFPVASARAL